VKVVYIQEDDNYDFHLIEANYTYIHFNLTINPSLVGQQIPLRICKFSPGSCNQFNVLFSKPYYDVKLNTIVNLLDYNFTLGFGSTTVVLQDANTENLDDTMITSASPTTDFGAGQLISLMKSNTPENYWGLLLSAWHYGQLEPPDFDKAQEHYLKAISADNSLPYAFRDLGKLYQIQGDKDKADEVFVVLGKMMPDDFDPVGLRVTLLGADYQGSLELTRGFLKKHPENPDALGMEARLQRELKDWPGYIDACRRVLVVEPEGGNAYNLACAFSLGGEVDSAFAALELASKLGYNDLDQYQEDEDLIPLHEDARWGEVLVMVETAYVRELARLRQEAAATTQERRVKALKNRMGEPAPDWSLKDFGGAHLASHK